MFNIVEERISSYNADGRTTPALVAYNDLGEAVAVAKYRKFETREAWERRVLNDAMVAAA